MDKYKIKEFDDMLNYILRNGKYEFHESSRENMVEFISYCKDKYNIPLSKRYKNQIFELYIRELS